ncbi:hypothetical protein ACYZUA_15285 [Pseudomonas sp. LS2P72]
MAQKFYAQDTCFYSSMGTYSFEDRCETTKAVGYDATYLSIWDGRNWAAVEQLNTVKERYDLEVAGIYVVLNLRLGIEAEQNAGIYKMLQVAPPGSTVESTIKTAGDFARSDPRGDEPVVRWLAEALSIAQQRNIRILIYSHSGLRCLHAYPSVRWRARWSRCGSLREYRPHKPRSGKTNRVSVFPIGRFY